MAGTSIAARATVKPPWAGTIPPYTSSAESQSAQMTPVNGPYPTSPYFPRTIGCRSFPRQTVLFLPIYPASRSRGVVHARPTAPDFGHRHCGLLDRVRVCRTVRTAGTVAVDAHTRNTRRSPCSPSSASTTGCSSGRLSRSPTRRTCSHSHSYQPRTKQGATRRTEDPDRRGCDSSGSRT